jgi:hypothetical protein
VFWGGTGDEELHFGKDTGNERLVAVGSTSSRDLPRGRILNGLPALPQNPGVLSYGGGASDGLIVTLTRSSLEASTFGGEDDEVLRSIVEFFGGNLIAGEVRKSGAEFYQGFIAVKSSFGNYMWELGGSGGSSIRSLAWEPSTQYSQTFFKPGVLYFAGECEAEDLETTGTTWSKRSGGKDVLVGSIYLEELKTIQGKLQWLGIWGGPADEVPVTLEYVAGAGLFVLGNTNSDNIEHQRAVKPNYGGGAWDGFLLQLDADGNGILRSTYIGGSGADRIETGTATLGGLLVAGSTDSVDWTFPGTPLQSNLQPTGQGSLDAFVGLLSMSGNVDWGVRLGGSGADASQFISFGREGIWVAGTSENLGWLSQLNAAISLRPGNNAFDEETGSSGGKDVFAFRFRTNLVGVGPIRVGQNLRAPVAFSSLLEKDFDGLVEIVAVDPSKVLVAVGDSGQYTTSDEPRERVVLRDLESALPPFQGGRFVIDAVGEVGETEILLRVTGMPDRRFSVSIVPSALYVSAKAALHQVNTVQRYKTFFAPLEKAGKTPVSQRLRYRFRPQVDFASSNPSALIPLPVLEEEGVVSPIDIEQSFDLRASGSFELIPRSPFFPAAPGEVTRVSDVAPAIVPPPRRMIASPQGLTWYYTMPSNRPAGPIQIRSENPDLVLVSLTNFSRGSGSVVLAPNAGVNYIFCQTLGDSGRVRLLLSGANGWTHTEELILVPTRASFSVASKSVVRGDTVDVFATFRPEFGRLLEEGPEELRPSPAALANFPTIPLLSEDARFILRASQIASLVSSRWVSNGARYTYTFPTVGEARFLLDVPPYILRDEPLTSTIQIRMPSFKTLETEIVLPQGTQRSLNVLADLPRTAQSQVRVTFQDSGVAVVRLNNSTPLSTADFGSTSPVQIVAKGLPGESTILSLVSGEIRLDIRVRIVPLRLVAMQEEQRISGTGNVSFAVSGIDGSTPLGTEEYKLAEALDFTTVVSEAGVCDIGPRLRLMQWASGLTISCGRPGLIQLELKPLPPLVQAQGATFTIRSGQNPLADLVPMDPLVYGTPVRLILGSGLQMPVPVGIAGFPMQGTEVRSLDPDLVKVSRESGTLGGARVVLSGTSEEVFYLQALNRTGMTHLRFSSLDGRVRDLPVFVWKTSLVFSRTGTGMEKESRYRVKYYAGSANESLLGANFSPIDPISQEPYFSQRSSYLLTPGRPPSLVRSSTSNPAVLEFVAPTPVLGGFSNSTNSAISFRIRLKSKGSSLLELEQPEGFVASPRSRLLVEAAETKLVLNTSLVLAPGLQRYAYVAVENGAGAISARVTLTSTNPESVLLSTTPDGRGERQLVMDRASLFYVRGLKTGDAGVRIESDGFEPQVVAVSFAPIELAFDLPAWFNLNPGVQSQLNFSIQFKNAADRLAGSTYLLNPDAPFQFVATVNDPSILSIGAGGRLIAGDRSASYRLPIMPLKQGEVSVRLQSNDANVGLPEPQVLRVSPWPLEAPERLLNGSGLCLPFAFRNSRPTRVRYRIEAQGQVSLGLTSTNVGNRVIEFDVEGFRDTTIYIASPLGNSSGTLIWTAPDSVRAETKIETTPAGFVLNSTRGSNSVYSLGQGTVDIPVDLSAMRGIGLAFLSPLIGAQQVQLKSSNSAVATFVQNPLIFPAGKSQHNAVLRLLGPGTTILSLQAPTAFNLKEFTQEIVVTVR